MKSLRAIISAAIPDSTRIYLRFKYRSLRFRLKYYNLSIAKRDRKKTLIFILDPSIEHPGLADRLKAIVSSYYIAKANNADFKILFNHPFNLKDYLVPNVVDWSIDETEIEKSLFSTKLINYTHKGFPKLTRNIQYHIRNYAGDILDDLYGDNKLWSQLFNELFKPSPYLQNELDNIPFYNQTFSAVHFRFVNDFEIAEPLFPGRPLSAEKQNALMNLCFENIKSLEKQLKMPMLIFSDSMFFQTKAKERGLNVVKGSVGHIGISKSNSIVDKTFVDFFMFSKAYRIYSLTNNVLYRSAFPLFGAMINGKTIERLRIKDI